ncbi:asparagine amidohydrolase [Burkholderia sp. WAC0059]|uniref:asparaginase n=1 Tax=Burkholderia sp. WAC0059 TaxID=2066022 RepID=UPI000C7F6F02|nr:asparaginase [Burkholderia sp. WAC0059]PLZ01229.1 asparagine amidohydrolase [Burkholderia sp. WAC0059]
MTTLSHVPIAVATRNGHVERTHWGSVAVVDTAGALVASMGDPEAYVFSRSTLKPFQAVPFVRDGGASRFGFSQRQVALLCSSHSGEDFHVDAVTGMLAKVGVEESDLRCGVHLPLQYSDDNLPPHGSLFDQRHNNCSGKHTGFLGYCCMHGHSLGDYLAPDHPLQRDIAGEVAALSGLREAELWFGTDGCSAPNIGMPLSRLAMMWARLAAGRSAPGANRDDALGEIFAAMTAHPEMVSGTGRCDLAVTRAFGGDGAAKVGADGVYVMGVRSRGLGIAIKIADGNRSVLYAAAVAVLKQLGLLDEVGLAELAPWSDPVLRNARGLEVGRLETTIRLAARA